WRWPAPEAVQFRFSLAVHDPLTNCCSRRLNSAWRAVIFRKLEAHLPPRIIDANFLAAVSYLPAGRALRADQGRQLYRRAGNHPAAGTRRYRRGPADAAGRLRHGMARPRASGAGRIARTRDAPGAAHGRRRWAAVPARLHQ